MLPSEVVIQAENRSDTPVDIESATTVAREALARIGHDRGELGLIFVDLAEIERLNREYLDRSGATDVISFPLDAEEVSGQEAGMPLLLGDVVICPAVAVEHAREAGIDLRQELCLLVIHGIIHIAGYDHETDDGEMDKLQSDIVAGLCPGAGG